jgi:Fe-S-cluster-containing hydrogenase component 2
MEILEMDERVCVMRDSDRCIECGSCVRACPKGAIMVSNVSAPQKGRILRTGGRRREKADSNAGDSPVLVQLMSLLSELNPVQQTSWKGMDISRLDDFTMEGYRSSVRCYTADKLEKIGVACINFHGLMTASIITVAPGPEYDIPYYGIDWDESEDHIFFYCDFLPTDDPVRNTDYLQTYLYAPLEEHYQTYCTMPGLKNNIYHWARAIFSPYVLTGTIDKSNNKAIDMLYNCTADYLQSWIKLWKSAAPQDPNSDYMKRVQTRRRNISQILHDNDPGGPPVVKLIGRESAHIALEIALP